MHVILISIENIDDVEDEEEKNSSSFLDHERMELLPIPSTSQGHSRASAILKSTENDDDDDDDNNDDDDDDDDDDDEVEEEEDSFTTQQLFSFAWQIARGMVGINITIPLIRLNIWLTKR